MVYLQHCDIHFVLILMNCIIIWSGLIFVSLIGYFHIYISHNEYYGFNLVLPIALL